MFFLISISSVFIDNSVNKNLMIIAAYLNVHAFKLFESKHRPKVFEKDFFSPAFSLACYRVAIKAFL